MTPNEKIGGILSANEKTFYAYTTNGPLHEQFKLLKYDNDSLKLIYSKPLAFNSKNQNSARQIPLSLYVGMDNGLAITYSQSASQNVTKFFIRTINTETGSVNDSSINLFKIDSLDTKWYTIDGQSEFNNDIVLYTQVNKGDAYEKSYFHLVGISQDGKIKFNETINIPEGYFPYSISGITVGKNGDVFILAENNMIDHFLFIYSASERKLLTPVRLTTDDPKFSIRNSIMTTFKDRLVVSGVYSDDGTFSRGMYNFQIDLNDYEVKVNAFTKLRTRYDESKGDRSDTLPYPDMVFSFVKLNSFRATINDDYSVTLFTEENIFSESPHDNFPANYKSGRIVIGSLNADTNKFKYKVINKFQQVSKDEDGLFFSLVHDSNSKYLLYNDDRKNLSAKSSTTEPIEMKSVAGSVCILHDLITDKKTMIYDNSKNKFFINPSITYQLKNNSYLIFSEDAGLGRFGKLELK